MAMTKVNLMMEIMASKDNCTQKLGSWSFHLIEDIEDPEDGPEAYVDDGESLDGLEKH